MTVEIPIQPRAATGLQAIDEYRQTLKLSLVSFVIAMVVCMAINVDQAVECLVVLGEDFGRSRHFLRIILLYVSVGLLASMLWYWGRALQYAFLKPTNCKGLQIVRSQLPRLIGLIPFVGLCIALLRIGHVSNTPQSLKESAHAGILLTITMALAAVFYAAVVLRRRFLRERGHERPHEQLPPASRKVLAVAAFVALGCVVLFTADCQVAQSVGAVAVLLSSTCIWVVACSIMVYGGLKLHLPVFWLAAGWVALWAGLNTNDNHQVRHLSSSTTAARMPVGTAFDKWYEGRSDKAVYAEGGYPVIVVAAEGGGIYAAYNTALVLSDLQDRQPAFAQHVFAISGVSGGSVGASVFTAMMSGQNQVQTPQAAAPDQRRTRRIGERFFYPDFLSPLIAKAAYPDLFQQSIPWPMPSADRARALEQSLELAWARLATSGAGSVSTTAGSASTTAGNPFADDFDAVWRDFPNGATPALLLNVTEVETGRQLAISNLASGKYARSMYFDEHPGVHLPLSTAAILSARFTLVTPAGLEPLADGSVRRYVDGGYFENSGMSMLSDVVAELLEDPLYSQRRLRLIVLRIGLAEPQTPSNVDREKATQTAFGELGSPIRAMLNTRTARETSAIARMHSMIDHLDRCRYVEFMLKDQPISLPLGWQLSERAKEQIEKQVGESGRTGELLKVSQELLPATSNAIQQQGSAH
jgi:predicted acylesterase/phospholipase RssA